MNTNVNLNAALGALAFLGTGGLLLLMGAVLLYTLFARKHKLTLKVLGAGVLLCCLYLGLMLAFSFASSRKALARGAEKHFCEIDCHLAYSVVDVARTKTLGNGANQTTAGGTYTILTIKTRFDETTTGATRGNGLLYPNSRVIKILDEQGREYGPSPEGQRVLNVSQGGGTPIETPLRPGESYTTTLVFDLPDDARNPTLLMNEGEWVTHFIIGHENSPLHGKTLFQLEAQPEQSAQSQILK
jgi:hypothetical protein